MRKQHIRGILTGKYENYPHCYVCNKPVLDYFSHALTDCNDKNGKSIDDLLLVLCRECYTKTEGLDTQEDIIKYINDHFPPEAKK